VPSLSVATIADLGRYPLTAPQTSAEFDPERVPVEFFDGPAPTPDCPLR
jgi:hypothetical protein